MSATDRIDWDALRRGGHAADLDDLLAQYRPAWMRRAGCRGEGPEAFFADDRSDEWRTVCDACDARHECLAYAFEAGPSLHGRVM